MSPFPDSGTAQDMPRPSQFVIESNLGGIISLRRRSDVFDTDYIWPGETLGNVVLRTRSPGGEWVESTAFSSGDIRKSEKRDGNKQHALRFSYAGKSRGVRGIRDLQLDVEFSWQEHHLDWTIGIQNATDQDLELGDLALPLPFNNKFVHDNLTNYTQTVVRHSFISGHASFIFWTRANGVGPYLVMTPAGGTKLEYYERHEYSPREISVPYWVYVHSGARGAAEQRGTWRQPHTCVTLSPRGTPGDSARYGFKFRWADDYAQVRQTLYEEGLFDVQVVPGMTVPEDLTALVSLRTKNRGHRVLPEHPRETQVESLGEMADGTFVYRVKFARLGENSLTVSYGKDCYLLLEFFVTQPLETLIKKRAAFLVERQQHRNPAKWYDGLFSIWDMRNKVLRGPENTDGFDYWYGFILACDDIALPKAPYLAAKNLHYPDRREIEAIEYYLEHFVWGKLQRTDLEEPFPYGVYGVPNWFENRYSEHSFHSQGKGLEHVWRSFDYPHLIMLYFHMYQCARHYPGLVRYLDARGYLERALGTAKAYYLTQTLPQMAGYPPPPFQEATPRSRYWAYTVGIYDELLIVNLIAALSEEGLTEEADWLRGEWEKKVKFFLYDDPYPFDSEFPSDTTAFESSHAIAKYALKNDLQPDDHLWYNASRERSYSHPTIQKRDAEEFLEKQIQANIASRGWLEPAYYLLGSDYRGGESVRYLLSYMSQMGGWALLDYALNYAKDPFPYLRLGYASYLSSWALMNTGTEKTGYGYWYPGVENDGASGWAFTPEKFGPMWIRKENRRGAWFYDGEIDLGYGGALRASATIVADDPLFGMIAYGGLLTTSQEGIEVIPRDGLRSRFAFVDQDHRLQVLVDWAGFASDKAITVKRDLSAIHFTLESRHDEDVSAVVTLVGFPAGIYELQSEGAPLVAAVEKKTTLFLHLKKHQQLEIAMRRVG